MSQTADGEAGLEVAQGHWVLVGKGDWPDRPEADPPHSPRGRVGRGAYRS